MSRTLRAASSISALTLVSRILGLVRDMVTIRILGVGWVTDAFVLAWTLPNMLRRLMGEGALAAAFIPAYSKALDRDGSPAATRILASVSGALILTLTVLSALVVVTCLALPPETVAPAGREGVDQAAAGGLLLRLAAILFPYVILVCLVAVYNGALNSVAVFGAPAMLPAILNVVWITALAIGAALYGEDHRAVTTFLAVGLLVAGAIQLAIPAYLLRKRGLLPRPRLPGAGDPARAVFLKMGPAALAMSLLQLNTLVDQGFAYVLLDTGANTHVYIANRLISFPFALTSLALATAVFPSFAMLASRAETTALADKIGRVQRLTIFLSVPASVGLILVAPDLIATFFAGDEFSAADVELAGQTTACLVVGLPFVSAAQLYSRGMFALGDTRTPARIATLMVPTNLVLNVLLVVVLDMGVPGLTLATSLSAALDALLQRRGFVGRTAPVPVAWSSLVRIVVASTAMGGIVVWSRTWFSASTSFEIGTWRLALPIALGMAVYGAVHLVVGSDEIRRLRQRGKA